MGEQQNREGRESVGWETSNVAVRKSLIKKMVKQRPEAVRSEPHGGRRSSQCKGPEVPQRDLPHAGDSKAGGVTRDE